MKRPLKDGRHGTRTKGPPGEGLQLKRPNVASEMSEQVEDLRPDCPRKSLIEASIFFLFLFFLFFLDYSQVCCEIMEEMEKG